MHRGGALCAGILSLAAVSKGCGDQSTSTGTEKVTSALGQPSPDQVPLDPTTVPMFVNQLPILPTFAPTVITSGGRVIRNEYTITDSEVAVQMLPPGFPATNVLAMGGAITGGGTFQGSPSAVFNNTRGIPTVMHWRTNITAPSFMPVDPTLHWANPQAIEKPTPPFTLFPPGYANAQFPVAHVTHTHGLMVLPQMDGTAEEWFTNVQYRGASFVTEDYTMPNDQPATQLFYHDHVMGETRLGVYAGEVGAAYFIREPNLPLDAPTSPLPKGAFEIPLAISSKAFFTDGELNFPPDRGTLTAGDDAPPNIAYWTYDEGADEVTVNGKVWPNLNVQRQQYRFRVLAAANTQLWDFQLVQSGTGAVVPFTIIGSDGGYLPAPQTATHVQMGITERADILVDFSQFAAGTQIILNNTLQADNTLGTVMRFTVGSGTAVHPPALSPSLFPVRPVLTANAPTRIKVLRIFDDLKVEPDDACENPGAPNCNQRSLDGLEFSTPVTELPLVGSTEEWDIINTHDVSADDVDQAFHQIHIHLLEYQPINRQAFDNQAFLKQWHLLNGHMPVSRPIVVDPTPYLQGPPIPVPGYETGWKDTIQAPPAMITRIMVRWAPQESTNATPGVNQYSIDPTSFPDNVKGPGYVWHCHIVGHEDHDMMRPLAVVNAWKAGVAYQAGNIIANNNIDYRTVVAHTSTASSSPPSRFDLWDRVNNNDGTWQPQIRYAQHRSRSTATGAIRCRRCATRAIAFRPRRATILSPPSRPGRSLTTMHPGTQASEDSRSSGAGVRSSDTMRSPWSSFVVVGRLFLLLGAALALVSAVALARARDRGDRTAQSSNERYVRPMHPEVVSRTAGECPICRMALERIRSAERGTPSDAPSENLVSVVKRRMVTQLVRAPAWLGEGGLITAVLHKDDLVGLGPGTHASFFGTTTSRAGLDARLSSDTPVPWDASTWRVRFQARVGSGDRASAPGAARVSPRRALDHGWVDIAPRPRDLLVVPSNAVLYTAEGPYVVAVSADGKALSRRPVEIGRILDSGTVTEQSADRFGAIVVLAGLREREKVVVEDTFFLDAERRLQEGRLMGPEVVP